MQKFETKRDELTVRGTVYGKTEGVKPAVILCHGFMANSSMCKDYAKLFAEAGWLAFTFDFCGGCLYGKSDGRSADMSVLTEAEDLKAVLRYVKQLSYVDREQVHLLGCSQGGFVSALTAAAMPGEIASLILLYPAFCIPDDARKGHMMFAEFDPENIPETMRCGPMKLGRRYAEDVIGMNVYKEIRGYDGPVLYLQGTADTIVDVRYAREANTVYPDCRYIELDGAGHMFRGKYDRQAKECIRSFLVSRMTRFSH